MLNDGVAASLLIAPLSKTRTPAKDPFAHRPGKPRRPPLLRLLRRGCLTVITAYDSGD